MNEIKIFESLNISPKFIHIQASDAMLYTLYNQAEAFVFPSLYEGFGIPILEAYACLCPAIISNTSCFPEIAADAAAYFNPYSEIEIADTIASVIYNPTLRTDLIHKGSEQIKLYSWEKLLSKQSKYISRPWKTKTNKEIIGMRKPVLSIITVNLNNNLGLQKHYVVFNRNHIQIMSISS